MSTMTRANRVVVKGTDISNYVAEFYRTHKFVMSVSVGDFPDELIDLIPKDGNKSRIREEFRTLAKRNADKFGINYDDTDRRTADNIRRPKYDTDKSLMEDTINMITKDIHGLIDKCKYGITCGVIKVSAIRPKTKTGSGTPLSSMGIEDGKYKNGNWAWANIDVTVGIVYKEHEMELIIPMQLVSGQLKKTKITNTDFCEMVKDEIISCGYATEDELNPKKDRSNKKGGNKDAQANVPKKKYDSADIKKMKKAELFELAKELGIDVTDRKFQTVRGMVTQAIKKGE